MVDLLPTRKVLTAADAGNQLQSSGLAALGLAVPALATGWAASTPSAGQLDDLAMTLTLDSVRAPFKGMLGAEASPRRWYGPDGTPVAGPVVVLRLHPDAALKLEALTANLLGTTAVTRPLPAAMVVHGVTPSADTGINSLEAGEPVPDAGGDHAVSFHDDRGLPIDPLSVASLFLALQTRFPALAFGEDTQPGLTGAGGLDGIARHAERVRFQVVDLHGRVYKPSRPAASLKTILNGSATDLDASGMGDWQADMTIGRASGDQASDDATPRLFWGFSRNATLGRTALPRPAAPDGVTLANQFFRITAVDLDWHLLGNRSNGTVDGVRGDDGKIPGYALPVVRPFVPGAKYLVDAQDALGACGEILADFPPADATASRVLLCSAAIDNTLALPPAPGVPGHWPAFPPGPATTLPPTVDPSAAISGTWASNAGPADAIVTLPADAVPAGTHLRIYPRRFQVIRAIGQRPSFLRGDGGSTIAVAGTPSSVLLANPFGLSPTESRPDPAMLTVDVVAVGRDGKRRIASMVEIALGPDAPFTPASFGGTAFMQTPAITALTDAFGSTSIAPAGLFGIEEAAPTGPAPADPVDVARALASETTRPRSGPRLPSQGRFETVLAVGSATAAAPRLAWKAVLTGARWSEESRCAQPELGDPGNPPGPDVFATGIQVSGQLAQDLALHALKRAQPIFPLPATPGWVAETLGEDWRPAPLDADTATVSGAMLETIAPIVDSPELSQLPASVLDTSLQGLLGAAANLFGATAPTWSPADEAPLRSRIQREATTARVGQRDALWSLLRAIGQARGFIYIESPQFARTGDSADGGTPDLVKALGDALDANPALQVMIAVPRVPDFATTTTKYEPFVRAALAQRKSAIESLTGPHRTRVAAFHPIGFPGRTTFIRSTTVVVDDVYAFVGTSHLRRRGMTFDGGADVATVDRNLDATGASAAIRAFRQQVMASRLGVPAPTSVEATSAFWARLATGHGAFGLLEDLLSAGGLGRCQAVWAGPTDTDVIPASDARSDPIGTDSLLLSDLWNLVAGD